MKQKLTHLSNSFCKEHCKFQIEQNNEQNIEDDTMLKGRIIEAEAHKELLTEKFSCSPERCQECNNVLC